MRSAAAALPGHGGPGELGELGPSSLTSHHSLLSPYLLSVFHMPQVKDLPLPGVGSVSGFSGSRKETELFFSYTSFAEPGRSKNRSQGLDTWCGCHASP